MGRVRKAKRGGRAVGFLVTWDLDSRDKAATMCLYRFVFGEVRSFEDRVYSYPGYVTRDGVRYIGQSVLFVPERHLGELRGFLSKNGTDHEVIPAILG